MVSIKLVLFPNGIATVCRIRMILQLALSTPTITANTVPMKMFASILRSSLADARISPNPHVMCPPASGAMTSTVVLFRKTPIVLVTTLAMKNLATDLVTGAPTSNHVSLFAKTATALV